MSNAIRMGDMSTLLINYSHAQTTQIENKKFNFLFSMVGSILGGEEGGGVCIVVISLTSTAYLFLHQ